MNERPVRAPVADPRLGVEVQPVSGDGPPAQRLVVLGDSLLQGFQSGAVIHSDVAVPALLARALGVRDGFRYPRYGGPGGGPPLNVEWLLRELEARYGLELSPVEVPFALLRVRALMDELEDHWERGPGSVAPDVRELNQALAMYSWDLRDVLARTAATLAAEIGVPRDDAVNQLVEDVRARAALRVYPHFSPATRALTLPEAAAAAAQGEAETLIVMLGANNVLRVVTTLKVVWSGPDFRDLEAKRAYTVWRPEAFAAELAELTAAVESIPAQHVIWATVPHVTIAPLARGVGTKVAAGSRYFPYYTRPWIDDERFDPARDPHFTAAQAEAVDAAVDAYNEAIAGMVRAAREHGRDWYLFDLAGMLDRLATRRFVDDPDARPAWWAPYPLPPAVAALDPVPDSHFLTGDGHGGRATGGLFSLDGVHPTTVGYGLIAQELVAIMRLAGVACDDIDFDALIGRDTLITAPPQNLRPGLSLLGWADEALDWLRRVV